ncbi:hypothetical protein FN846DRAFT_775234 [Sphaerosporella brunnea]|uniref:Uncharacterized protein n=1 Tax=Sphaerosporella brunnea TaxID=1250544 RepID=A0A5J5F2K1_9PEZI|nr:hypothetical protein FN846DRAFT_775234 [Sphaerosporella brunnea]
MTVANGRHSHKRSSNKRRPSLPKPVASAPAQLPLATPEIYLSPPPSTTRNTTTVAELAHLVKQQAYHEQKHSQSKLRLQKSLISNGVSARLTRTGDLCHRILVDHFKSDQKSEFAALYNAIHDVRNSCEASRRFAMLEPELNSAKPSKSSDDESVPTGTSFLQELPAQARETILTFISSIRSSPHFLANRLSRLSNSELESLVRFHHQPSPQESILPQTAPSRRGTGSVRGNPPAGPLPSPVERLLAFHRNDPLYTLLHSIFANSTGPDSSEDVRKLDVWSTTCARLISENKGESFLMCVMDSWAAMREWPARANLEICIMDLVQEGSFLVERTDDQANGRPSSDVRGKHDLLAEEFWTKAERRLFEVLDDEPGAGGIPEGILELGHAILERMEEPKKQRQAEIMIVVKWFFNRFLANGVAYPEYHGIMTGHHISEHARLKILRPVLKKMYNHAVSVVFGDWKTNSPVEPVIRTHIENLLERFRCPRPVNAPPVLVPTKTVTSPAETPEVQSFLVLCPADIVTLCNAVYPHTATTQLDPREIQKRIGSRPSSRMFAKSPGALDGAGSVLSDGGSSLTSESASITAPLLERGSFPDDRRSFMSLPSPSPGSFNMAPPSLAGTETPMTMPEKASPAEVRSAIEAMRGRLGADAVSGRCHPCAERWAVIYISSDGEELSLKMRKEWEDDDDEEEEEEKDSDSEDEQPAELNGLDRDYDQLKQAVLKLVDEYEIPEEAEKPEVEERPILKKSTSAPVPTASSPPEAELDPSNPFHQSNLTAMFAKNQSKSPAPNRSPVPRQELEKPKRQQPRGLLLAMLQAAYTQCYARGDYVSAQQYFRALAQLRKIAPSLQRHEFSPLLHIFSHSARRAIDKHGVALDEYEHWFEWVAQAGDRLESATQDMMKKVKDLRDKMWYVTDVRNSAAYDEARNVALALKKMGMPQPAKSAPPKPAARATLTHRVSMSSFSLLKSDTLIDILAAPIDHGGPNKLSDEQATMTSEYLSKYSVENFCKGEERIHRFCLEVDKCVTKLVGDGILDGPVLWSSELFWRDEREMSINRQKGELYLAGVGTLSVTADEDYETDREDGRGSRRSLEMLRRPSTSDLFGRNRSANLIGSLHDPPPSRKGRTSRSNIGLMDAVDRQDFFGMPNPALPSETHNTFWSPFSSHNTHTATAGRPKTAHSPTTLLKTSDMINQEKKKFLAELKQNLTGLLLSDLGLELFSHGSETDGWFSGGLGDDCIQRKEEQDEVKRKAAERKKSSSAATRKALSKKKSMKAIRKDKAFELPGKERKGELAAPVATFETVGREAFSGEENSSSNEVTTRTSKYSAAKKGSLMAFPYGHAFRRLLLKFSTHPNPFQKLHALYELERLIVASLSRNSSDRRPTMPSLPSSPFLGATGDATSRISTLQLAQPTNIEQAIANLEERRSNVINSGAATRSNGPLAPSTDMIVDVLQSLFRQADIRPKTLFRDLQFVAAFVPASILDMTEVGKAFWDAGLAALGLKQDVCRTMVEIADEIVARDAKKQRPESAGKEKGNESSEYLRYSMQDAASMWTITAREGDPTAQRELAIFYLTNPSLLPRITKPLSKPKDTFRPDMMVAKGEDPEKRDPATMCVAYHWMELSAQGGDELARKYLRSQREEW